MPGLVVFNRRWSIGSDDLVGPAATLAVFKVIWIIALCTLLVYIHVSGRSRDQCAHNFIWYPGLSVALLALLLASHVSIAVHSARGGVFDAKARAHLPLCCYIRTALLVLEVVWSCAGCVLLSWKLRSNQCTSTDLIYVFMCAVVGTHMVVIFLTVVSMYCCFDTAGRTFQRLQELRNADCANDSPIADVVASAEILLLNGKLRSKYEEKWMNRVHRSFRCVTDTKPNDKAVFKDIALLLASYLNDLDLVLSDYIAGMILLRNQQRALFSETIKQPTNDIYQYLSGTPISPRTKFLTLKDDDTQCELSCMVHFAEYAVASYGWQGQCFFYPGKACCNINVCGRCKGCPGHKNIPLLGDNCCQCQYTAITKSSALLSEDDFIYGNYENEPNVPSYFVCLDHQYKKVLLCVRGTMSLSDALIDLQGDCGEIKVSPSQPTWQGHKGMISAATNVYRELLDKQVLESAFSRCETTGYKLLVIGHSLGAGVAAIIAFMLREQYPQLYCYAYSPPGGLLSPAAMEESKRFTTSIVVGKDVIPRLGLAQLEYLRSDLLSLLENSTIPKWRILSSGLPLLNHCFSLRQSSRLPKARSQNYNPFLCRALSSIHTPMFLPGRVLHVVKNYPKGGKKCKPLYQAIWSENGAFDTIVVSPSMIEDHMPNTVFRAMQELLVSHGPKKPGKVLTEEERQAILLIDDEPIVERGSHGSDLSWEYTCQMEANAVLQKASEETTQPLPYTPPTDGVDTPTQWQPAPLASQEDLLSIRRSTPSLSSHKGLSESTDVYPLPVRSKSLSDGLQVPANRVNRNSSVRSAHGRANDVAEQQVPLRSDEAQPVLCVAAVAEEEPLHHSLEPATDNTYFAHLGEGNQSEYNGVDHIYPTCVGGHQHPPDPPAEHHSNSNPQHNNPESALLMQNGTDNHSLFIHG